MTKIGIVYTGLDASAIDVNEGNIRAALAGKDIQILTFCRPDVFKEVHANTGMTPHAAQMLAKTYFSAMEAGVDVIYNVCSSVGDIADLMQPAFEAFHVPIVRCDEEMMRVAATQYKRIAIVACFETVMGPSYRLLQKCIQKESVSPEVTKIMVDGWAKPMNQVRDMIVAALKDDVDKYDVVVLTQASHRPITKEIEKELGLPVFSASFFGPQALADVIETL